MRDASCIAGRCGAASRALSQGMHRGLFATIAGLGFIALYLVAILALADHVLALHWSVQAAFFVVAGIVWVVPIRWLMFWAAGKR